MTDDATKRRHILALQHVSATRYEMAMEWPDSGKKYGVERLDLQQSAAVLSAQSRWLRGMET